MQRLHIDGRRRRRCAPRAKNPGSASLQLCLPCRNLIGVDVEMLGQLSYRSVALDGGKRHLCLKGRGMVPARSSAHGLSCSRRLSPLSGRNSTYRPVQISGTGSLFALEGSIAISQAPSIVANYARDAAKSLTVIVAANLIALVAVIAGCEGAFALSLEQARASCRETVGHPIVHACMQGLGKGGDREANLAKCRAGVQPQMSPSSSTKTASQRPMLWLPAMRCRPVSSRRRARSPISPPFSTMKSPIPRRSPS